MATATLDHDVQARRRREWASLLGVPLRLNPVNQRRLANFKANKRAYWSLVLFVALLS